MSELYRSSKDRDPKVFVLQVTLAQPLRANGRRGRFTQDCIRALSLARPRAARNWAVRIQVAKGCVIRTSVEAASENDAKELVVGAIEKSLDRLHERPSHLEVRALTT